MDMLLLIIGVLIAVWYFGLIRSVRRLAGAADTKAAELQLASLDQFKSKYDAGKIQELKEAKELLNSF